LFSGTLWLSLLAVATACAACVACGFTASRAPLGGDYSPIAAASVAPRAPRPADSAAVVSEDADANANSPGKSPQIAPILVNADAGTSAADADVLRYEPFKTGEQIRAEVSFGISSEVQSGSSDVHGGNKLALDAKVHVDVKIVKSSAQSLEELEVTLTPISMHTDFDGQSSDSTQDPTQTYDITLSGQAPNIRARRGSSLEKEDRATLIILITPLLEFHNHWARSPTLPLKSAWSSKVPLAAPSFLSAPGDTVHVGPLLARYNGRDGSPTSVPFELGLPIEWSTDFGALNFDLNGRALLGAKGRPISLDLSGPLTGNVGPSGSQLGLRGTAKFAATLTYP
jgi:hypothetical protein